MTKEVAAAANHAALGEIFGRVRVGSLFAGLPPLPHFRKVGAGHSMGAMQTIVQQANFASYDQIALLGYTAFGVHLHVGGGVVPGHREIDPNAADYWQADRTMLRTTFHWEDVPEPVLAADDALLVEVPYVLSTQSIQKAIVAADAKCISVPVYICLGERDVSPDSHAEPGCYSASRDVTLHILPRGGHCQNFASTRAEMWNRIHAWIPSGHGEA